MKANWQDHHIEGFAVAAIEAGKDGRFEAPLISHIEDNLYVGGCINGVVLEDDWQTVVSLYKWERYSLGPTTERVEVTMYDAGTVPDVDQLHELADTVVTALARGGKVLVHCQAGLNRSNLVTALALIKMGRTPADAIALLREKRSPVVLCNVAFERWLLEQGQAALMVRICDVGTCAQPAQAEHTPCCSSTFHGKALCCEHYCRAHFVEVNQCSPAAHGPTVEVTPKTLLQGLSDAIDAARAERRAER